MNVWKRNAVVAAVVLFVCGAVYLNWSYQKGQSEEAGKTLGEAELVSMQSAKNYGPRWQGAVEVG